MKMKHIVPISVIVIPYLIISPIALSLLSPRLLSVFAGHYIPAVLFVLFPASLILNVIWAFSLRWDTGELVKWNLGIKLWLIPFYLFAFVFAIGVPLAILFIIFFEFLLLLATSCYGFRAAVRARKEEKLGDGMFLLLFLCHFYFVADVIAALILKKKLK